MVWVKQLIDNVIQDRMGHPDLEFVWSDKRPVDPSDQQKMLTGYVKEGLMTRNEARDDLGMTPIPGGDDATVEVAGQGILLVEDIEPYCGPLNFGPKSIPRSARIGRTTSTKSRSARPSPTALPRAAMSISITLSRCAFR